MGCLIGEHIVFNEVPALEELTEKMGELAGLPVIADKHTSDFNLWSATLAFQQLPRLRMEVFCDDSNHSPQVSSPLSPAQNPDWPWLKIAQEGQYCVTLRTSSLGGPDIFFLALYALESLGGRKRDPKTGELCQLTEGEREICQLPLELKSLRWKFYKQVAFAWLMAPLTFVYVFPMLLSIPVVMIFAPFYALWCRINPKYAQKVSDKPFVRIFRANPEAKDLLIQRAEKEFRDKEELAKYKEMLERAALRAQSNR